MTRKTRTILFLFLLILFLLAAPLTVLYCLGWRFDWETKKVFQPGVFYFKVLPKNVQIYFDGEPIKKTDFFFGSVLIENLLPKKYNVEIKKEGFHSWKKTLEIKEREVTEAKNIILVPENPKFNLLFKGVEDFFFSPDRKKIILKEEGDNGWSLKLFELEKNVKSHLIGEKDISKEETHPVRDSENSGETQTRDISNGAQLIGLKFSPDSKIILLEIGVEEKLNYYLLEIDKTPPGLTSLGSLEKPEEFFLSSPLEKEVIDFAVLNKDIYYLDQQGFLFKNEERLNIIPIEIKQETKYEITASNSNILLQENDILYIFDENKKSFQKIFEPVKDLEFSPDSKKLVYFNNYEIWVLFLEKITEMPQKETGDKIFLTRFSEEINDVFWYTNHYLVFNVGDKIRTSSPAGSENLDSSLGSKIKIAEIDDRDRINIVDLTEFPESKIFWNQFSKKLYILSEENLYTSEKLVP